MNPFAALADFPRHLRQPQVRDLAWIILAPPLLHTAPWTQRHPLAGSRWAERPEDLQAWLLALDDASQPLVDWLAQAPTRRLGLYYERLWQFALHQGARYRAARRQPADSRGWTHVGRARHGNSRPRRRASPGTGHQAVPGAGRRRRPRRLPVAGPQHPGSAGPQAQPPGRAPVAHFHVQSGPRSLARAGHRAVRRPPVAGRLPVLPLARCSERARTCPPRPLARTLGGISAIGRSSSSNARTGAGSRCRAMPGWPRLASLPPTPGHPTSSTPGCSNWTHSPPRRCSCV